MRSTLELDRLSAQDASNLRIEARGVPMHVAALAILEGAPLRDAEGRLRLESLRGEIGRRLHLAPRLRQVIHRPSAGPWPTVLGGRSPLRHRRARAGVPGRLTRR